MRCIVSKKNWLGSRAENMTMTQWETSVLSQRLHLAEYRTRCNNRHVARQYSNGVLAEYWRSTGGVLAEYRRSTGRVLAQY